MDLKSGKLDYGLLNLDATTEQGKMIRELLGGERVEDLQGLLKSRKTRTKGEEASKAELVNIQNQFAQDIPALELQRKAQVNKSKQDILAKKLKSLR